MFSAKKSQCFPARRHLRITWFRELWRALGAPHVACMQLWFPKSIMKKEKNLVAKADTWETGPPRVNYCYLWQLKFPKVCHGVSLGHVLRFLGPPRDNYCYLWQLKSPKVCYGVSLGHVLRFFYTNDTYIYIYIYIYFFKYYNLKSIY